MNISQWKIGDRTFFSLEVDDRLLLVCWVVLVAAMLVGIFTNVDVEFAAVAVFSVV